jgi:hypothetical protein
MVFSAAPANDHRKEAKGNYGFGEAGESDRIAHGPSVNAPAFLSHT